MKIGIMGGTFDPIHLGHLIAAERAKGEAGLDEVWFMPASTPPHKAAHPGATPGERLDMVKLAISGCPYFRLCDIEIRRGGVSYTMDTVERLVADYPADEFHFIIGADMVEYLPKWYRIDELVELISFIGLSRPGFNPDLQRMSAHIRNRVRMVELPLIQISSTEIRTMRSRGQSIRFLVPDAVFGYMEGRRLYEPE